MDKDQQNIERVLNFVQLHGNISDKMAVAAVRKHLGQIRAAMRVPAEMMQDPALPEKSSGPYGPVYVLSAQQWDQINKRLTASVVPEGWKPMPPVATPEMLAEIHLAENFTERALQARYAALYAAAPEVPSEK